MLKESMQAFVKVCACSYVCMVRSTVKTTNDQLCAVVLFNWLARCIKTSFMRLHLLPGLVGVCAGICVRVDVLYVRYVRWTVKTNNGQPWAGRLLAVN